MRESDTNTKTAQMLTLSDKNLKKLPLKVSIRITNALEIRKKRNPQPRNMK